MLIRAILISMAAIVPASASATHAIHLTEDAFLWGIASQGYVYTSRHSFFGSEDDPFNYREITLGGQYRMMDNLSVNMQGEYRDAGQSDNLGVRMSQAFMDGYFELDEAIIGANMGRVEVPFGLYGRTRDRVDTRPSILLPQSIYPEAVADLRNQLLTGDGAVFYGVAETSKQSRVESRIAIVTPVNVDDTIMASGWAAFIYDKMHVRLTLMHSDSDAMQFFFPVLSAQYTHGPWIGTVEYGQARVDSPFFSVETDGGYGQIQYQVNDALGLFARYDSLAFQIPVGFGVPSDRLKGRGIGVGFGWDITNHVRLNMEYHMVDGTSWLNAAENPALDARQDYDIFIWMLSFRF